MPFGKVSKKPLVLQSCVAKVIKQGRSTSSAFAICTAALQRSGKLMPGTRKATAKGKAHARKYDRKDLVTRRYERALERERSRENPAREDTNIIGRMMYLFDMVLKQPTKSATPDHFWIREDVSPGSRVFLAYEHSRDARVGTGHRGLGPIFAVRIDTKGNAGKPHNFTNYEDAQAFFLRSIAMMRGVKRQQDRTYPHHGKGDPLPLPGGRARKNPTLTNYYGEVSEKPIDWLFANKTQLARVTIKSVRGGAEMLFELKGGGSFTAQWKHLGMALGWLMNPQFRGIPLTVNGASMRVGDANHLAATEHVARMSVR